MAGMFAHLNTVLLHVVLTGCVHMVFNITMNTKHEDAGVIDALGGPTKVAMLLGLDIARGGVQRVTNWKRRGIPPRVRLDNMHVFGKPPSTTDVSDAA